jgi:cephalosporin hydroxylase
MGKIIIDTVANTISTHNAEGTEAVLPIYSQEGFRLLSDIWLKQEWNQLHWQSFSWLGFQIWQFPEDLLRLQEVVATLKPEVIVETGVNRGGSAIFFASLCRLLGKGRVVSIDIRIPPEVRQAVEHSPFSDLITLIEGDSTAPGVVAQVEDKIGKGDTVLVFLDSDHAKAHVLRELQAYSGLVTPGSYIIAADGVMQSLTDTPYGCKEWAEDNPAAAAREFAASRPEFAIQRPTALFGDQYVVESMTFWPDAWLYRLPVAKGDEDA